MAPHTSSSSESRLQSGVPSPLTASKPGVAGNPALHARFLLLPLTMSVPTEPPALSATVGIHAHLKRRAQDYAPRAVNSTSIESLHSSGFMKPTGGLPRNARPSLMREIIPANVGVAAEVPLRVPATAPPEKT